MSRTKETTVLVLTLLVTGGLLGGAYWLLSNKFGFNFNSTSELNAVTAKSFKEVPNVPSGIINYGGSTSWAPLRKTVDSEIQKAFPEFKLRYVDPLGSPPGSGTGIKMLVDGKISFSQSSRPIEQKEYELAQQRNFKLEQIPVAIDGLAVAVNPSLNIPGLTLTQLKDIYSGKINNWQQLGGANLPIKPFSRRTDGGTVELFVQEVMAGQAFGKNVEFISTTTEALRRLSQTPGAIYYASAPEIVPQCSIKPLPLGRKFEALIPPYQEPLVTPQTCGQKRNQLNINAFQSGDYPLTRNFFVIVKKDGKLDEQAGAAYANLLLSSQGQQLISEAGFVRIR